MSCRSFKVLVYLSHAALVITCALWIRSYFVNDSLHWWRWAESSVENNLVDAARPDGAIALHSSAGYVAIVSEASPVAGQVPAEMRPRDWAERCWYSRLDSEKGGIPYSFIYFRYHGYVASPLPWHSFWLLIPYWLVAMVFAVLPIRQFIHLNQRRRRRRRGECESCGYDLRTKPARCPECGMPIPSSADASLLPE